MAQGDNTIVLRVQLDEGGTEKQLQQLVLDIEATKKAQTQLNAERKAGKVSDEQYAQQTVALRNQLKGQQAEQTALTKNLDLYRQAVNGTAGSYDQLQAQLTLAQRQFRGLADSGADSTQATQALSEVVRDLRGQLKQTDASSLDQFFRNIGNYPKTDLDGLIQQLVKVEEVQKSGKLTTEQAAAADRAAIGFKQQIAQAGAKEGLTYEQTTDKVQQYGEAIRPATQALVQQEQQRLVESGQEASEQVQKIGFRISALQKDIAATPAQTKKLSDGLKEVASQNTLVATATEKYSAAKEKFTQASNLAKLAIGGEVTALGLLRLALIATGLGALVVVLGSVVTFLTKTAEGTKLVETVMAQVGAAVNVVVDRFAAFGKAVVQVLSGDFSGAAATAKAAVSGIGDEMVREVQIAGDLSKAQQQLNRDRQANADTNKRLLRDEENLKNIRDDESKALAVRRKANEDAFAVEQQRERILVDIAQRQVAIYKQEIALRGGRDKADKESLDKLAEAEAELADVQEDAAGRRNEYITNRFQLAKDAADKEKELADKNADHLIQLRKDALALEAVLLDRQLKQVQASSDEELSLLQQKLQNQYQAELNVKKLTVSAKKVIDAKYESDSLALSGEFLKKRALAAYDAELATVQAELTAAQKGSQQETELRVEAINTVLAKELAGLDKRADAEAKANLLRARAEKDVNDVRYASAAKQLEGFIQGERNALEESYARGKISKAEYDKAILTSDITSAAARKQLALSFNQDAAALEQQLTTAKIAQIRAVTDAEKAQLQSRQEAAEQLATQLTGLFAETVSSSTATMADFAKKSLAILISGVEQEIVAAQIKILVKSFTEADSIASFGVTGALRAAAIITTVTAAAEILKSKLQSSSSQFALGGVLTGPSHAQGGIPLFSRHTGQPLGATAEGDEIILTKGVWQSNLLRPLASQLNVLGGGRPLMPSAHLALGGIIQPVAREYIRQQAGGMPIDYERLAQATAAALRQSPPVTRWVDYKAAEARNAFTDRLGNS